MEEKKKGTLILDISEPRSVNEDITSLQESNYCLEIKLLNSMKKVLKLEKELFLQLKKL